MPEITQTALLHRNWLPALSPVWDSAADPVVLSANRRLVLGADQCCDQRITIPGVADKHCVLEFRHGTIVLLEVHAAVWINDFPARSGACLRPGDRIALGSATFRVDQLKNDFRLSDPAFSSSALQVPATGPALTSGEDQSEQMREWQRRLQDRGNESDHQYQDSEPRSSGLTPSESESAFEASARHPEGIQAAVRSDRLLIESERSELFSERSHVEADQSEIVQQKQEHLDQLTDFEQQRQQFETQEQLLEDRIADFSSQYELLKAERVRFEENVAAHALTVEEDLAWVAAQNASLDEQQNELTQQAHRAEQMLTVQQQKLQHLVELLQQDFAKFEERQALMQPESIRQEALVKQQRELEEQNDVLRDREAIVVMREAAMTDREHEFVERCTVLERRELSLAEASREVSEQQVEHQDCMDELERWEEELLVRQNRLQEQTAELKSCRQDVEAKQAELTRQLNEKCEVKSEDAALQTLLNDAGSAKEDMEFQIASLRQERDELMTTLRDTQASVEALQFRINEGADSDEVADLKALAAALQAELTERYELIAQQKTRLQELETQLPGRDKEIRLLQERLELESTRLQNRFPDLENAALDSSSYEADLLRQIETLQKEVKSVFNPGVQDQYSQQQSLILQLTEQLEQAERRLREMQEREGNAVEHDEELYRKLQEQDTKMASLQEQLQDAIDMRASDIATQNTVSAAWQQQIEERDLLIRELQQKLVASQSDVTSKPKEAPEWS